jgi:hypothetical protein
LPARLFPIFRDQEELPVSADLNDNIHAALRSSRYLIVLCSPRAAASLWVNEEIRYFKSLGREDRVLSLIVDGEPNAGDKPEGAGQECFPSALRYQIGPDGHLLEVRTEPIADHYELALNAQNLFDYRLVDDVPRPDANRMPGLLPREGFAAFLTARARY